MGTYEETALLEPQETEEGKNRPPCCASTHCSRVGETSSHPRLWITGRRCFFSPIARLVPGVVAPSPRCMESACRRARLHCASGGGAMPRHALSPWMARRIAVRHRLPPVCVRSLLLLMVVSRTPALEDAARFAGLNTSPCSQVWKNPAHVARSP